PLPVCRASVPPETCFPDSVLGGLQTKHQIVRDDRRSIDTGKLEFCPDCFAVRARKAVGNFAAFVIPSGIPKSELHSAATRHTILHNDRLTRVLASRADLAGGLLDSDKTFAAVHVRPYGVLNRGRDADPLPDLGHVEVTPGFITRPFSHGIAEPRLDFVPGK